MSLEERIEKLERRRSRLERPPNHIGYVAVAFSIAAIVMGVVNTMKLTDIDRAFTEKLNAAPVAHSADPVPPPIRKARPKMSFEERRRCGDPPGYWCQ